jgi:hypothetical protein
MWNMFLCTMLNAIKKKNNPWRNNPWGSRPTERPPPASEASANF